MSSSETVSTGNLAMLVRQVLRSIFWIRASMPFRYMLARKSSRQPVFATC